MKNENSKQRNKTVWIATIVAILMLLLAVTATFTQGFTNWNNSKELVQEKPSDNGSPVTGEEGEELPSDATIPMPSMMTFRSATKLDGEGAEYDSVTLIATVKPDNATNKLVNWTVSFVNASSDWATGKNATDYVTVTPAEAGSTTATVQCLQPFGEQIQITVTSRENANATASCTIDFAKRMSSLFVMGNYTDSSSAMGTSPWSYDVAKGDGSVVVKEFDLMSFTYLQPTYTEYTVDDTFTMTVTRYTSKDVWASFESAANTGYEVRAEAFEIISSKEISSTGSTSISTSYPALYQSITKVGGSVTDMIVSDAEAFNALTEWLGENPTAGLVSFGVKVEGTYSNAETMIRVDFDSDSLTYKVTGVELDKSNVVI